MSLLKKRFVLRQALTTVIMDLESCVSHPPGTTDPSKTQILCPPPQNYLKSQYPTTKYVVIFQVPIITNDRRA